jgi:hypothetical protein
MAISSRDEHEHEMKWVSANMALGQIGFWVQWQHDFTTDSRKYAIGLRGEKQPMGIYEGEEVAHGMVKMLLSNAKHEGG